MTVQTTLEQTLERTLQTHGLILGERNYRDELTTKPLPANITLAEATRKGTISLIFRKTAIQRDPNITFDDILADEGTLVGLGFYRTLQHKKYHLEISLEGINPAEKALPQNMNRIITLNSYREEEITLRQRHPDIQGDPRKWPIIFYLAINPRSIITDNAAELLAFQGTPLTIRPLIRQYHKGKHLNTQEMTMLAEQLADYLKK